MFVWARQQQRQCSGEDGVECSGKRGDDSNGAVGGGGSGGGPRPCLCKKWMVAMAIMLLQCWAKWWKCCPWDNDHDVSLKQTILFFGQKDKYYKCHKEAYPSRRGVHKKHQKIREPKEKTRDDKEPEHGLMSTMTVQEIQLQNWLTVANFLIIIPYYILKLAEKHNFFVIYLIPRSVLLTTIVFQNA